MQGCGIANAKDVYWSQVSRGQLYIFLNTVDGQTMHFQA